MSWFCLTFMISQIIVLIQVNLIQDVINLGAHITQSPDEIQCSLQSSFTELKEKEANYFIKTPNHKVSEAGHESKFAQKLQRRLKPHNHLVFSDLLLNCSRHQALEK